MRDHSHYETAQICINGHVITSMLESNQEGTQRFCQKCGAKTITACDKCNKPIRGYHIIPGVVSGRPYLVPSFCYDCGTAYPWVAIKLQAARDFIAEIDNLSENEKGKLGKSLDDIIADTPKTTTAVMQFKKIITKAGAGTASAIKEILVNIVSEAVRKNIWGS